MIYITKNSILFILLHILTTTTSTTEPIIMTHIILSVISRYFYISIKYIYFQQQQKNTFSLVFLNIIVINFEKKNYFQSVFFNEIKHEILLKFSI
jgi:septum formation topological specificity factor MinE